MFVIKLRMSLRKYLDGKDPNSFSDVITNLEKKFFVSSKKKSLYKCLKEESDGLSERDFSLRKRIGTFRY